MKYFKTLVTELNSNKIYYQHHTNVPQKNIRQSSVALIFKINNQINWQPYRKQIQSLYISSQQNASNNSICPSPLIDQILQKIQDQSVELLFARRAQSGKDSNSGYIVFPGGKCENNETDLTACIRETRQQVGIKLLAKQGDDHTTTYLSLYLGKLSKNFFYRKYKDQKLFISCHLFLILMPRITITLNTSQLIDINWVKFSDLLNLQSIQSFRDDSDTLALNAIPSKLKYFKNSIVNNLEYVQYPSIDVNLEKKLFGATFHIWLYICRMIDYRLKIQNKDNLEIKKYLKQGQKFRIKFCWYYIPGYFMKYMGEIWNYKNRIEAFGYPERKKSNASKYIQYFVLLVLVSCAVGYFLS